jgi:hypothetical protein
MGYYYIVNGVDIGQSNVLDSNTPSVLYDERILQLNAQNTIQRASNLGSDNPFKGPAPRTLFYDAGFRRPGKYGQFLMYASGNGENDFMESYYSSENATYNSKISSIQSKNPSAAFLVSSSAALEASSLSNTLNSYLSNNLGGSIVGGLAAPYNWKDFLYCKYYGTIPNNYMVTLRRFPTPMRDNLSLPSNVANSDSTRREGAGRPVAQAVTWLGGDTGNTLSSLIGFTTGLVWDTKAQSALITQEAFDKGLFNSLPYTIQDIAKFLGEAAVSNAESAENILALLASISDPNQTAERGGLASALRDKAIGETTGPLSDFIWTSVDTVSNAYVRGRGLSFTNTEMSISFHYDLTSIGEVNTKAAMLDLMGSLLGLGTNYGNFLTPNIRYNSEFPSIGFPGGNAGLASFYRDPINFIKNSATDISALLSSAQAGAASAAAGKIKETIGANGTDDLSKVVTDGTGGPAVERAVSIGIQESFIAKVQLPLSFLTGAPIGEWHLVVGNPCNPIAMIGNLICENVKIEFSERLGPDDFPAELKATYSLKHGRDRERGDIESMFNRGDGRLYQSSLQTYANGQSDGAFSDTQGNIINQNYAQRTTSGSLPYTQSDADSQGPITNP